MPDVKIPRHGPYTVYGYMCDGPKCQAVYEDSMPDGWIYCEYQVSPESQKFYRRFCSASHAGGYFASLGR